jgi:hypothetical protein
MKPFTRRSLDGTFESELLARIGPTLCHSFYFPYAANSGAWSLIRFTPSKRTKGGCRRSL